MANTSMLTRSYMSVFVHVSALLVYLGTLYNESLSCFQSVQSSREHDGGGSQKKHGNQRRKDTCFRKQVMSFADTS